MKRWRVIVVAAALISIVTFAPSSVDATRSEERGTTSTPRLGRTVAVVRIPKISLNVELVYGIHDGALARGLGLWPGTGLPGRPGNAVIAGHRTSHGAPMRDIDKLKVGDRIFVTMSGRQTTVHQYRVTKRQVVKPDAMWITRPTRGATLTIFACHPPHSIAYRYVIFAKLVGRSNVGSA